MTTLQLIFYQAHEIARREMACDVGRQFYGSYRAAFADALRTIYSERKQDDGGADDRSHIHVGQESAPAW